MKRCERESAHEGLSNHLSKQVIHLASYERHAPHTRSQHPSVPISQRDSWGSGAFLDSPRWSHLGHIASLPCCLFPQVSDLCFLQVFISLQKAPVHTVQNKHVCLFLDFCYRSPSNKLKLARRESYPSLFTHCLHRSPNLPFLCLKCDDIETSREVLDLFFAPQNFHAFTLQKRLRTDRP